MKAFAELLDRLALTPSRNAKLRLIRDHLANVPDPDRGWALAALTGGLAFKEAKANTVRKAVETRIDEELFRLSYDYVGDLAETVALIWPAHHGANREPHLSEVIEALNTAKRSEVTSLIENWLDALDAVGRWALLKLVTGGLRVGVSARLAWQAAADYGSVGVDEIQEIWHGQEPPYLALLAWLDGKSGRPETEAHGRFRPVMLAHPIDEASEMPRLNPADFVAEWKWDGIRVQAVAEGNVRRLYSRSGEDISPAFPDVIEALNFQGVIDGELIILDDGQMGSFSELQQRLNRKSVDAKRLSAFPAGIRAYDLLSERDVDTRPLPFFERRARLETLVASVSSPRIDLSPLMEIESWEKLAGIRANPPVGDARLAEGLMLKRRDSPYQAGRPKGSWFKWKRDPMFIDAVLMYAQRGHGKRSSYYSDFTFGVWTTSVTGQRTLTPVGKAYFGFTDLELKQLDKFVRDNTTDRFGPVRAVRATNDFGLVVEVAFEGLQRSTRHKSGVAMRFPRIHRIRWDKPAGQADELALLEHMLGESQTG